MKHKDEVLRYIAQSGHWSMTVEQLLDALEYFFFDKNGPQADVVQYTEVSPPKFRKPLKRWCKRNNLKLHHPRRRGAAECMTISAAGIRRRGSNARLLTRLRLKVGRTDPTYMLVTKIPGWGKFRFFHTPAHTLGLKRGLWPTRVYHSVLDGVRRVMDSVRGYQTAGGDMNLELDREKNQETIMAALGDLEYAGDRNTKPDIGNRLITGIWTNLDVAVPTRRLPRQDGHDHAPEMTVLRHQPHPLTGRQAVV